MIADTIKNLRQQSGLTQSDLAKRLNITRSSVNAWEMGISIPSTQYVVELAELFKVTTDYILGLSNGGVISTASLTEEQTKILLRLFNISIEKTKRTAKRSSQSRSFSVMVLKPNHDSKATFEEIRFV